MVYLAAAGTDGIAFSDWSGDPCALTGSDPGHCRIYMDGDHSVTARFGDVAIG